MKHFHGTPLGGVREGVSRFFARRFAFIPFGRTEDLPIVAEVSIGFAFDNGAFTAWKSGNPIDDWSPYFHFCREWARHPRFEFAIIPDEIEGTESDNDKLIQLWDRKMWHPVKALGVPVWHLHESLERLDRLVRRHDYVALGSSGDWPTPGANRWHNRMAEAMSVACDEHGRPKAKLHGLRMLSPEIVERYPFASADSTNVAQNKSLVRRFGAYTPPTSWQRAQVIAERIEASVSPGAWDKDLRSQLELFDLDIQMQ